MLKGGSRNNGTRAASMERILSIRSCRRHRRGRAYAYVTTDASAAKIQALEPGRSRRSPGRWETQTPDRAMQWEMIRRQAAAQPHVDTTILMDEKERRVLEQYAKQDGVTKLPSGLMYRDQDGSAGNSTDAHLASSPSTIAAPSSTTPSSDSSHAAGERSNSRWPSSFLAGSRPRCLMKGDTWEVALPYELGYGAASRPRHPAASDVGLQEIGTHQGRPVSSGADIAPGAAVRGHRQHRRGR